MTAVILYRAVRRKFTDVSEVLAASIIRATNLHRQANLHIFWARPIITSMHSENTVRSALSLRVRILLRGKPVDTHHCVTRQVLQLVQPSSPLLPGR
jgi:hypothetical protein